MPSLVLYVKQSIEKEIDHIAEDMVNGRVARDEYLGMTQFVRGLRRAVEILTDTEVKLITGEDEEIQF